MSRSTVLMLVVAALVATTGVAVAGITSQGPARGLVTATLTEQWRAGGEDSEIFFGNISAATVDADGHVILLDSQLSQALVLDDDGELVTTLGREGEGPGEVRNPGGMLTMPDGDLCLLQTFPGRIVRIHPDGTPAGEFTFAPTGGGQGQFVVLVTGLPHPEGMVLAGIGMSFGGAGQSVQDYFLSRCDDAGHETARLLAKRSTIDYSDFELSEMGMDFIWSRCATGPDGAVYAAPDRNAYRIEAWRSGETSPDPVFGREVAVPRRDAGQKDVARRILEGVGANYPVPPKRLVVEDTPTVIAGMWCTDDGLLWVMTSPGINTPPTGCWVVLDIFDGTGNFVRQVALPGDFDPQRDGLQVLRDGRVLVTVGALDAFLNQQAVAGADDQAEADPLEVICYDPDFD